MFREILEKKIHREFYQENATCPFLHCLFFQRKCRFRQENVALPVHTGPIGQIVKLQEIGTFLIALVFLLCYILLNERMLLQPAHLNFALFAWKIRCSYISRLVYRRFINNES